MTDPRIEEAERNGSPGNRYCDCGNLLSKGQKICNTCLDDYQNQQCDDAEDDALFN